MINLARGRKQDLIELTQTLNILIDENFKILEIKDAIVESSNYVNEFTNECLTCI